MDYYKQIFRRKSFHHFKGRQTLSIEEMEGVENFIRTVKPLDEGIRVCTRIVPASETVGRRDAEYCILFYSQRKGDYLRNIGYMGEQIDLYLASQNIGALWLGLGKPRQSVFDGLHYVIMIAIAKMPEDKFRQDMFAEKRKRLEDVWSGDTLDIAGIVRFSPSACNTQPWIVQNDSNTLKVYRNCKRTLWPVVVTNYYNRIDVGIFLFILEICLNEQNYTYERSLFVDVATPKSDKTLIATYDYALLQD